MKRPLRYASRRLCRLEQWSHKKGEHSNGNTAYGDGAMGEEGAAMETWLRWMEPRERRKQQWRHGLWDGATGGESPAMETWLIEKPTTDTCAWLAQPQNA